MVGLHYLKHTFNESDESFLDRWQENPYWQYFCGFGTMQHVPPLHSSSLTKWRNRVGSEKLLTLFEETIAMAQLCRQVTSRELAQVNVDTTVAEKNIPPPDGLEVVPQGNQQAGRGDCSSRHQATSDVPMSGYGGSASGGSSVKLTEAAAHLRA